MPRQLQPAHSDFECADKMGLSAFEPQFSFTTLSSVTFAVKRDKNKGFFPANLTNGRVREGR